jgi:hypothetical protein
VPAARQPGFAAAAALVAALRDRQAVAVTTDPVDAVTEAVLALAEAWAQPLVLEVWGGDGPLERAEDHGALIEAALTRAAGDRSVVRIDLPVELSDTRILVEVAGEVAAWGA